MSDYPGAVDTFRSPDNVPGNSYDPAKTTAIFSEDFSTRSEAIVAIEETLGTDPQGASATVKARLAAIEAAKQDVSNKSTSTSLGTSDTLYPSQNAVKAYVDAAIAAAKSALFPVGSYYINQTVSTNPGTLLGFGTWIAVQDKMIMGVGSTYGAGTSGGSASHSHPLSAAAQAKILAGSTGVKGDFVSASYTATRQVNTTGTTISQAQTNGTPLMGATDSTSTLPPYITAYVWLRTA